MKIKFKKWDIPKITLWYTSRSYRNKNKPKQNLVRLKTLMK